MFLLETVPFWQKYAKGSITFTYFQSNSMWERSFALILIPIYHFLLFHSTRQQLKWKFEETSSSISFANLSKCVRCFVPTLPLPFYFPGFSLSWSGDFLSCTQSIAFLLQSMIWFTFSLWAIVKIMLEKGLFC